MIDSTILQLGAVAIVFLFSVKEFFSYLKNRKNGNSNELTTAIFNELRTMNTNHLHSIQGAIEEGNKHLVDVIHQDNMKIIELLGEIKGTLK